MCAPWVCVDVSSQDCEAARCRYMTANVAASYGRSMLNASRRFVAGAEPLPPPQLFQYSGLRAELKLQFARGLLRADEPGTLCGVPTATRT